MLVVLAAQFDDWGENLKYAGGQRWKKWLREKKKDPDVGNFLTKVYPYDD